MDVLKAFQAVVDADDAAGAEFIGQVVYDFMADLAELHRDEIEDALAVWSLDRVQVAKRALGRSYVASTVEGEYPSDDVHKAAAWLAGLEGYILATRKSSVSKGFEWFNYGGTERQVSVNRDAQGRFARGINQTAKKPLAAWGQDKSRMSPSVKHLVENGELNQNKLGSATVDDVERHQSQFEEAGRVALELKDAFTAGRGSADGVDVVVTIADESGNIRMVHKPLSQVKARREGGLGDLGSLRPNVKESIISVELAPGRGSTDSQQAARVATFNLLGGAGGAALASLAQTDPKLLGSLKSNLKMPNQRDERPKSALSRVFGVLEQGGRVLEGVTGAERLGQAAHLVGVLGPQAEEVMGPYVKRAAYRYRGTETTPNRSLSAALASPDMDFVQVIADGNVSEADVKRAQGMASPLAGDAIKWRAAGLSGDSLVQQVRADEASVMLARTLPDDPFLAELSAASGQVLPSQGVIISADGRVVSQSVGFTDDHYLPFDLANLGRLRGGQYVRTRQQGGLTGEDIYAATMSGARQVQVVSSSGVFTLEFAPDFRGARANSDKARGMYDRYLKILDAVDASNLYLEDISPRERAQAWSDAQKRTRGGSDEDTQAAYRSIVEEKRRQLGSVTVDDVDRLTSEVLSDMNVYRTAKDTDADVVARMSGGDRRRFENALEDRVSRLQNEKANKLRLNAEGYEVALKTLQQQFPYFIKRTSYQPLDELPTNDKRALPKTRRYSSDQGYARPGSLRADSVRSGFYNPGDIEPGMKERKGAKAAVSSGAPGPDKPSEPGAPARDASRVEGSSSAVAPSVPQDTFDASGVSARLAPRRERIAVAAEKKAMTLSNDLGKMAARTTVAFPAATGDFAAVADNKQDAATWLMVNMNSGKTQKVLSDPATRQKAAVALADRDAVEAAFNFVIGENDGKFFFDAGRTVGGADNMADASDWMVRQGKELSTLIALQSLEVDNTGDAFHTGMSPMAHKGISDIASKEDFEKFKAENPEIFAAAEALVFDADGEHEDIVTIGSRAGEMINALKKVSEGQESFKSAVASRGSGVDPTDHITEEDWAAAGLGVPLTSDSAYDVDAKELAQGIQRAWDLAVVGRALEVELNGGDVFPKGQGRLFRPEVAKQAPRVVLLDPDDPLARRLLATVG